MDERQAQIKEGAGLEESRVNQEFLDFLNKWSFPVLLVVALVSGGYFVYNQWQQRKLMARDEAFAQLGAIEGTANPSVISLTGIAEEFDGIGSVSELAMLQAADIRLNAARTGIDPEADPAASEDATLSEEDIAFHLEQAGELYRRVASRVSGQPGKKLFAVNAAFGLAAVAESTGDDEEAKRQYAEAERLATEAGYAPLAKVASELSARVGNEPVVTLHPRADLPRLPFEPEPAPEPVLDPSTFGTDDGEVGPEMPQDEQAGDQPGEQSEGDAGEGDSSDADSGENGGGDEPSSSNGG